MSKSNRATDSKMSQLHALLATRLIEKLNDNEVDASVLNAASKFLKDNSILSNPDGENGLNELSSILSSFEKVKTGRKGANKH